MGRAQCCNTCDSVRAVYMKRSWAFDASVVKQCLRSGFVQARAACAIVEGRERHACLRN